MSADQIALLNVSQTATQLFGENTQYKRRVVHRLIDAGELEAVSVSKHRLVPLAEIKRLRGERDKTDL